MAKLSAATRNALSVVAHSIIALNLEQKVMQKNSASGFYEFWLKNQSAADKAIIEEFSKMSREAYRELARLLEEKAEP